MPTLALPRSTPLRPLTLSMGLALAGIGLPVLACDPPAGRLTATEGRVEVRSAAGGAWQPATLRQTLCPGDQVAIRGAGRAAVVLAQDVLVRLDKDTTLTLPPTTASGELGLQKGIVHVISRFNRRFGIITPFVNAFVDGTEFTVSSDEALARVVVSEGHVRTGNAAGEKRIGAGEAIEARAGGSPVPISVRPLDAVAWAIYYPQVQFLGAAELGAYPEATRGRIARAQQAATAGDFPAALAALDGLPDGDSHPELAALKAGILLGLGEVEAASALAGRFPSDAHAGLAAVRAVAQVARQDKGALATARQAVALDPRSAAAQLALSYALQAERQLPAALQAARSATELEQDNPIAWARRAELELASANAAAGGESARRAAALAPDTPRALALAAFARLMQGETSAAAADFQAVLARRDTDPLAHFGLGLALMRQGDTAEGRREVEIAGLLDPSNAELRSYLGRAYLEESRSKVAGDQFDLARRLDPQSPTPWYFDAFRALRDGEPLLAIDHTQEALARNDNRAVLRPSALIDQDRAARSASIGAAYQQVGFASAAHGLAMNAIDDDAASPAAHRLLADVYAELPRFEHARQSELLQANLRQPIGQWPQPPQAVMPPTPLFDGPRAVSPDEASAFFERKPTRFAATLGAGSHSATAGSVLVSHAWEQGQLSFGSFDYRYAGLTDRIDDTHLAGSRLDARFQVAPGTTVLAELRHTELGGGLQYTPLFDGQTTTLSRRNLTDLGRVGLRQDLGDGDELLVEANTQRIRFQQGDFLQYSDLNYGLDLDINIQSREQIRGQGLSAIYSRQRDTLSLQAGGSLSHLKGSLDMTVSTALSMDPSLVLDVTRLPTQPSRANHDTLFGYTQWRLSPTVTLHGGADYVRFDDQERTHSERVNGKLGIVARPAAGTTLRAALFQGVSGSRYSADSLAPTQFAGFNQVFDEIAGTRWRRAAAAVDQTFAGGIKAGLEASGRWLDAPMVDANAGTGYHLENWKEALHRAHLAVPLGRHLALGAEWRHEAVRYEGTPGLLRDTPYKVTTDMLPLRLWAKAGPADALLEHWVVRQHASQIAGNLSASEREARSTFTVTNLRLTVPVLPQRLSASLGVYNLFDRQFRFHNTDLNGDPRVPLFYAQRTLMLQGQLRF